MKPSEREQVEFIKQLLLKSGKRGEIIVEFGKKWQNASERTFDRRLKTAQDELEAQIKVISAKAEEHYQEHAEAVKTAIIGVTERMEILSKIAKGEITYRKPVVVDGMLTDADCEPDFSERKNAIAELNKMDGSYAAQKQEISVEGIRNIVVEAPDNEQPTG